ncbi:hypothetical protein [Gordonia alkaliphila]
MAEIFQRHWPVIWRIDAAEAARAEGADRVVYVPGPCGGDKYGFERWAGWAEITICADPVFGAARALYTILGLDPAYGRNLGLDQEVSFAAGRGLLGLDVEQRFLGPSDPDPESVIDIDRIADLLPV